MDAPTDILERLRDGELAWLEALTILAGGLLAGFLVLIVVRLVLRLTLARRYPEAAQQVRRQCKQPLNWLLPLVGLAVALRRTDELPGQAVLATLAVVAIIAVFALLLIRVVAVSETVLTERLTIDAADNLRARRLQTQFRILRRFIDVVIVILAVAAVLLQFDGVRQFGRGLLASAGIASIVLGLAAQKTLGNLIAGVQIAISQPIRIDDVVVVEDEWGRIEEITLSYVVVRIWDDRRLILPISYFLDHPFTNWTRTRSELLGTVFLHVDYAVPIDALRHALREAVIGHPDWDERVCEIVAYEARERTLELRALVSARDSAAAWRLRCHVREALIGFLLREHPEALPKIRLSGPSGDRSRGDRLGSGAGPGRASERDDQGDTRSPARD